MRLTSIHRYPLKSAAPEDLTAVGLERWGLHDDRRWMVVDPDGVYLSAREAPRLLAVQARPAPTGLRLSAAGMASIDVPYPDPTHQLPVRLWSSEFTTAFGTPADDWLSRWLDRPVRLVHLDDPTRRAVSPSHSLPTDRVALADGYPLLVATEASLAALNDAIATRNGDPVPMHRFRPNIVIDGDDAWTEDQWRLLRVGDATFRAVKGCARCIITSLVADHAGGVVTRAREPLRTLARTRRHGKGVWFGMNLIPDTPGVTLRVGDAVEIIESAAPGTPPLGS